MITCASIADMSISPERMAEIRNHLAKAYHKLILADIAKRDAMFNKLLNASGYLDRMKEK